MQINIFSVGERILLDFEARDVGLSNSMARPMKSRRCVFNKVFLVTTGVIFLIVVTNGCVLIGPKP